MLPANSVPFIGGARFVGQRSQAGKIPTGNPDFMAAAQPAGDVKSLRAKIGELTRAGRRVHRRIGRVVRG